MSFVPAFEIGVWNVWIFMAAWVFFHLVPFSWPIFRYDLKGIFRKSTVSPSYSKNEKTIEKFSNVIWVILFIYSIFLPLPSGTPLLYTGIALFAAGVIIGEIAFVPWTTTPLAEPVTKGLYRYSRHPIYIAVYVQYIGIGIASASGLFLLLTIVLITLAIILVPAEERLCREEYGEAYLKYLDRTPRWIGIPK